MALSLASLRADSRIFTRSAVARRRFSNFGSSHLRSALSRTSYKYTQDLFFKDIFWDLLPLFILVGETKGSEVGERRGCMGLGKDLEGHWLWHGLLTPYAVYGATVNVWYKKCQQTCLWTLVSCSRLFSRKMIFCFCARLPPDSSTSRSKLYKHRHVNIDHLVNGGFLIHINAWFCEILWNSKTNIYSLVPFVRWCHLWTAGADYGDSQALWSRGKQN